MPIVPGARISISFHNIIPASNTSNNMGAYLQANNQDGVTIAQPVSIRNCGEMDGKISIEFVIYDQGKLDALSPNWNEQTVFFKFNNFVGFVVLDEIEVAVTKPLNQ